MMNKENMRYAQQLLGDMEGKTYGATKVRIATSYVIFTHGQRTRALPYNLTHEFFKKELNRIVDELGLVGKYEATIAQNSQKGA